MDKNIFYKLKEDVLEVIPKDHKQARERIETSLTYQEIATHLHYDFGTFNQDLWEQWQKDANELCIQAQRDQAELDTKAS